MHDPTKEVHRTVLNDRVDDIHQTAKDKGWWDEQRSPLDVHALIHSEIAEATECARIKQEYELIDDKPEGQAVELIDAVIRIMDYFGYRGWDFDETLKQKINYNKSRSYRHGNKAY